tara:strand:- start:537 stop:1940 length:1404 start_codon:yes stop_codon:yes gene_type:complete
MSKSRKILVASRIFSLGDQSTFAKFSGDFNPIHVDPIFARRTISGQCVVHGIHGLMWALDSLLSKTNLRPSSIDAMFIKPIFLEEEVSCSYDEYTNKLIISKDSVILSDISLKFDSIFDSSDFDLKRKPVLNSAFDRDINDLINLPSQDFFYRGAMDLATTLFSNIAKTYSIKACCEIAAISEIIGMQAPGLHSLFLSANINFQRNKSDPSFSIEHIDERFDLLKILVNGSSLICKIDAFIRQKPTFGPSLIDLQSKVNNSEFSNIKALIIGGSRGLGESVAKIIALGGGESVITYSSGYDDCLKISKEISGFGVKCSIYKLKIPDDIDSLEKLGEFNQVYYFPTPKIFGKRNFEYDKKLYDSYYEIYVSSFKRLVNYFNKLSTKVSIFYPSSDVINNSIPELSEYTDAKIEGEKLCKELNKLNNISILVSRIPRTRTDQTMSLFKAKSENPEDVMLPIIREMPYNF